MTDQDQSDEIQDAEVISDTNPSSPSATAFDADAYNATLEVVRRRLKLLEKAKAEITKLKEMYDDIFVNDAAYVTADKAVKEIQKKKQDVKAALAKQPAAVDTAGKMKDLKEQIKDNEEQLSQELMEYYKTSGVTEIEDADGNVQEFKIVVKLKPKRKAK